MTGRHTRLPAVLVAVVLSALSAPRLRAQVPTPGQPPVDTGAVRRRAVTAGQPMDSTTARRLGLPSSPSRKFAEEDSVLKALLSRPGYQSTRFSADSATLLVGERRLELHGRPLTRRQEATLEADSAILYREDACLLDAKGTPRLFDRGQVMVGEGIRYDTCRRRGVVLGALTNFQEGGTAWFLRGNVAADSTAKRIYAGSGELTSCNLPVPHYHFSAREVKWLSGTVLAARPVVLYVRDVPVLWLPFIFQDLRVGRHSGVLVPQVGFSDIVRPSRDYQRQITNLGYYWAPNDYLDVTFRADWYSRRFLQYGATLQYNVRNRFMGGTFAYSRQSQNGGGSANNLRWDHRQQFSLSTSLNFSLNYVSNNAVVVRNAINPLLNTQQITSSLNLSKRFRWGTLTVGGNRRQSLTDSSLTQQFPALTLTPRPVDLGPNVTWSPTLSLTNDEARRQPLPPVFVFGANGAVDTVAQLGSSRVTAFNFDTPLRFGQFSWRNNVTVIDQTQTQRQVVTFRTPDLSTPDPNDSITVNQVFGSNFSTNLNWDTGINLPILFRRTWKIQPVLGVTNSLAGQPFAIRNRNTAGGFVFQGKRIQLSLNASPTLFAFLPGFLPGVTRVRHSLSPLITFNYAPAATVSDAFARAISQPGQPLTVRSDPQQTLSVGLSQVLEGKLRPPKGDTLGVNARKLRLISITTSPVSYDFEQAKHPGRTGWATQTVTNSVLSDLLPGFNLTLTHDLWRGPVGFDTTHFDPFLQNVSAGFSVSSGTVASLLRAVGIGGGGPSRAGPEEPIPTFPGADDPLRAARPGSFGSTDQLALNRGRGFTATFNYSLSRTRPSPNLVLTTPLTRSNLNFSTAFSPTAFWSVAWAAQYNITDKKFESQTVRLERDLHEWRAAFNFVRNANGNVAFFFSIFLTDLPELKFDFQRSTFER